MASGEEDGEKKKSGMVGFMFGNVDKRGKLDEDYLEEEAKENLDALDGRIDIAAGRSRAQRDRRLTAKVGRRFEVRLLLLGLASRNRRDREGNREADCEGDGLHLSFRWLARFVLADGGADGPVLGRRDARVSVAPDPASIRLMRASHLSHVGETKHNAKTIVPR